MKAGKMDDDDNKTGTGSGDSGGGSEESESESSKDSGTGATDGSSNDDNGKSNDSDDSESLKAQLRAANREAAKYRKERNDAKSKLDTAESEKLSELEREKKRADTAEANLNQSMSRVREANLRVALSDSSANIVDIETAAMILAQRGITYDDSGKPENITDAVTELVKDKPFLVGKGKSRSTSGGTNGGAGGSETDSGDGNLTADELMVARAFKMTPKQYSEYKDKK